MTARAAAVAALFAATALPGCGRQDPAAAVVAEIGGEPVLRSELDGAVELALAGAPPPTGEDRDRVHSRLLDQLIDERLLHAEAVRRGVVVSEAEVAAYLADLPAEVRVARAEEARRHLAARKLQDALLRAVGPPSPAEIEALAARRRADEGIPGGAVVLRTLRLASSVEAGTVSDRIARGETTFEREVQARDAEGAAPLQVTLDRLPAEVGTAMAGLQDGEISPPVELHGNVYLFQLVSRGHARTQALDLREQAREDLTRLRGEQALRALLSRLRSGQEIRIHRERLGFRYVEEGV
jgi:parvulin-like peptidyl-prolyl isomerase